MEILLNKSIPVSKWKEFLSNNPYASPFQSPEFYNLFNSVKGLSAETIAISDSGSLKALAVVTIQKEFGIKGFFSRRAVIYGGPLIGVDHPEVLVMLLEQISKTINAKRFILKPEIFQIIQDIKKSLVDSDTYI